MKKWGSILFIVAMLATMLPSMVLTTSAATTGDWEYEVSNGAVTITDYTGSAADLTIPSTLGGYPVTIVGDGAFSDCYSLTSVTIGDSVTTIGSYAFSRCYSLTSVTIPDRVTTIGDGAFSYCRALASVTIPDSVMTIGMSAFEYCTALTNVTIPDSVTIIGDWAFSCCSLLTSVTIPDSVTTIGNSAFFYCSSLTAITVDESNTAYCDVDGVLFTKDMKTLVQYPGGKTATSYTIPDSVTTIGEGAFSDCYRLASVTIPDSVTTIGERAFCNCDSLTSVTIPDGVTTIGDSAFSSCESLTSVTIGNSVTTIGKGAFEYCYSLSNVYYSGSEADWNKISIGSYNGALTSATIHYNSTGTTTTPTIPADAQVIYTIETVRARKVSKGDTFLVDVTVNDIEKLCMVEFKFAYDATAVKAVSSELKGVLAGFDMKNINLAPGKTDLGDPNVGEVWITGMALSDSATKDGDVIATITFEALKDIDEGVSLYSYQEPLAACAPATPLKAAAKNGGLEIVEGILGDFDDNGVVNMMDALQVYSSFSAGAYPKDKIAWADMNGDGTINMFDCLLVFNVASGFAA